jgi:hypothetical protein
VPRSPEVEEQLTEFLDTLEELPDDIQDRFIRLARRMAALPHEVQDGLTEEQVQRMFDTDSDYPFN